MRSPSNQAMERANINMDSWIQEACYTLQKNYAVWKTKNLENHM